MNTFLFIPKGKEREYVSEEDIVIIHASNKEAAYSKLEEYGLHPSKWKSIAPSQAIKEDIDQLNEDTEEIISHHPIETDEFQAFHDVAEQ